MGIFDRFKKNKDADTEAAPNGFGAATVPGAGGAGELDESDEAPAFGWDAIEEKFDSLYPGQEDQLHYGTVLSYALGGDDPLDGISVYDGGDYWHFVTYGLSELYEKTSTNQEWSGFGFEFTLKLKKLPSLPNPATDDSEIENIADILQTLARYVFDSATRLGPYEYIYTRQEVGFDAEHASALTGFATSPDEAGIIDTPNGKVEFVCVVGLTDRELRSINEKERTVGEVLELLGSDLTDYSRGDLF
jgi:hypothetical protein